MDTEIRSGVVQRMTMSVEFNSRINMISVANFCLDDLPIRLVLGNWGGGLSKKPPVPFADGELVCVVGKTDAGTGQFKAAFAHVPSQCRTFGVNGIVGAVFLVIVLASVLRLLDPLFRSLFVAGSLWEIVLWVVVPGLLFFPLWSGIEQIMQLRLLKIAARQGT